MKKIGRPRKSERNKIVYKLIQQGKSFQEVAKIFNLSAKSTVHEIYHRERTEKLSTARK